MPVGAGGRRQGIAGLQNDADHPPAHQAPPFVEGTARPAEPGRGAGGCRWTAAGHSRASKRRRSPPAHQAPPVWRATRELRDKRGLAVELGGGARGRRGLDGMCTAMKSPTGVEGAGGRRQGLAGLRDRRLRAAGSRMEGTARPAWPAEPGRGAGGRRQGLAGLRDRRLRAEGSRAAISRAGRRPPAHSGPAHIGRPRGARKSGASTTSTHNETRPRPVSRPRPRRAQSVPLSKAAPPAIRRSCPRGPRPRRGQPRGGRRGRGTGSRTRSPGPRCGRSGSTAGRHRARHTRRA